MKKIRVNHVVGVDKENYYLRNLADNTDPNRVEHRFVTLAGPDCEFVENLAGTGSSVRGLGLAGRRNLHLAYRQIKDVLRAERPDIVHVHLFEPSLIGVRAAKKLGISTVMTRHHSDALHQISSPLKRRFYLQLENYISNRSDHIIAPSRAVRHYLVDLEGVPARKVSVIPYGQTTERYDTVTADKIKAIRRELRMDGQLSIVNVSRLFNRKGHADLFQAFAGLLKERKLNARLYLVGEGEYRQTLEQMCEDLGIEERVQFLGWRGDALAVVAAADLVVHPSLEDALSSAVIEAVMLEKPIVATDISGVRDSLDEGKYGRIVPPSRPDLLMGAIGDLLDHMPAAIEQARAGRSYLLDYMDAKTVADRHTSIYESLRKVQ